MMPQDASETEVSQQETGCSEAENLDAVRERLEAEVAKLNDLLLRRAAEFDNYRKRVDRERSENAEYASMNAVKDLLPVLDDLERALQAEPADPQHAKGLQLIYQRMYDTMQKLGLEPIEAEGRPFDPAIHHAIEMVESDAAADQIVLADLLRGYSFKGRLLRPSMVRVAVHRGN
jgi:molecular chaperone GrpE